MTGRMTAKDFNEFSQSFVEGVDEDRLFRVLDRQKYYVPMVNEVFCDIDGDYWFRGEDGVFRVRDNVNYEVDSYEGWDDWDRIVGSMGPVYFVGMREEIGF